MAGLLLGFQGLHQFRDLCQVLAGEGGLDFAQGYEELAHLHAVAGQTLGLGLAVWHAVEHRWSHRDGLEHRVLRFACQRGTLGGVLLPAEGLVGIVQGLHLLGQWRVIGADWSGNQAGGGQQHHRQK